ncbi:MAG: hypothetical protein Q9217_002918 [Psora testacea]
MDSKPSATSIHLFKEVRADIENPIGSTIQIQVVSTITFSVRQRQHRRVLRNNPVFDTQDAFSRHYLASSASIHHCNSTRYPRCFLWRVVNDQRVLELQSVDLSKSDRETSDAVYSIQLCFNGQLKHGGVALANTADVNVLNVFALTRGNELYTFAIRKDFFCYMAASEEDRARWCKVARPATFSIGTPHSLVAASAVRLIVSLSDGRLLQLTRKEADDGSRWNEAVYGDGQWGSSLRGLVRWQGSNTTRYDGVTLEQSTPVAMAVSPDEKYIFAVCINHTLRIWNPKKAVPVFSKDLLWQQREQHEIPKVMLYPGSPNVLQLFRAPGAIEGDVYYAVSYSPHDFGQFKFWAIRDPEHGENGVRDLFPNDSLNPPDPDPSPESKAIWKVVDFRVKTSQDDQELDIWVLSRSNRQYKLYNLKSGLRNLPSRWQEQWTATAMQVNEEQDTPETCQSDPEDATEKWLRYILKPGRYPEILVENALFTYCVRRSITVQNPKLPLSERMSTAITSQVTFPAGNIAFEKYHRALHDEWIKLWQEIRDLDKTRLEVLSLALDGQADIPWIVFADSCSAIRSCTRLETMTNNSYEILAVSHEHLEMPSVETETGNEPKFPDELAVIMEAAAALRKSFNTRIQQNYKTALANELWLEPHLEVPLRIQQLYDQCDIADDIAQSLFDDLEKALEPIGGPASLDRDAFFAIIQAFSHILPDVSSALSYTKFGVKMLIHGAREMIDQRERVLLDLLTLAVFVEMEVDQESAPMEDFDGPAIYETLICLLRQYEVMQWLVSNTRSSSTSAGNTKALKDSMAKDSTASSNHKIEEKPTILESVFAVDLKPQSNDGLALSDALTYNIQDLLQWVVGGNNSVSWDEIPVHIQCNLLVNKNIDLASKFLPFQPSTAWATYIKGRLYLLCGETTEAAIHFKKAAFKLSRPVKFSYHHASHSLLSPIEASYLGQGLPAYYTHIINLFSITAPPSHTQAAYFAHLALQLIPTHPPSDQAKNLLTSLFNASLQTTDFTTAYSAITRHPSPSTLLQEYIAKILTTPKALPQVLSLPWPPNLQTQIDALLSQHKNPKILAAWRLHHNDFRGAAAALLPSLQAAQARTKRSVAVDGLEREYLTAINFLACMGKENAWVLSDGDGKAEEGANGLGGKGRRKVITIEDLREAYQKELDRRSVIESGRFAFGGAVDEMDIG